jgi:hypothetical protein
LELKTPIGVEDSPIRVKDSPIGVEDSPIVVKDSPIGVEDSPIGVEDYPIRVEVSRIRVEDSLIGVEDSPIGVEDSPLGVEDSPIRKQICRKSIIFCIFFSTSSNPGPSLPILPMGWVLHLPLSTTTSLKMDYFPRGSIQLWDHWATLDRTSQPVSTPTRSGPMVLTRCLIITPATAF